MTTGKGGSPRAPLPGPLFAPIVAATISDYTFRLAGGQAEVWQLPHPLDDLAWTALAQVPDRADLEQRLARAEADADYWHDRAVHGATFEARRGQRMRSALTTADEAGLIRSELDVLEHLIRAAQAPQRRTA